MTRVLIDLRVMRPDGSHVPADGVTRWRPVVARVHEGHVDLPASFRAAPDATIDVTPSILPGGSVVVAYEVDEAVPGGRLRWVLVPDSADIVAYSALVEVDPGSLEPGADPDPAWWAALTDYRTETSAARDEAVDAADDAGRSAQAAESAAGTATEAAGSASDAARAVAEDRTAVETAHGLVTDAAQAVERDAETAVEAAADAIAAAEAAAAPTDTMVAGLIAGVSATAQILNATYPRLDSMALSADLQAEPEIETDMIPVGAISGTAYGRHLVSGGLWRLAPSGAWELVTSAVTPRGGLRLTDDGELLVNSDARIHRSTGWSVDPATAAWTTVAEASPGAGFIQSNLDISGQYVLIAEYAVPRTPSRWVKLSVDGGCTFTNVLDLYALQPGREADTHWHAVCIDPYVGDTPRLWASHGDGPRGVYYSDDLGATWTMYSDAWQPMPMAATPYGVVTSTDANDPDGVWRIPPSLGLREQLYRIDAPSWGGSLLGFGQAVSTLPGTDLKFITFRSDQVPTLPVQVPARIFVTDGRRAAEVYQAAHMAALGSSEPASWLSPPAVVGDRLLAAYTVGGTGKTYLVDARIRLTASSESLPPVRPRSSITEGPAAAAGHRSVAIGPDSVASPDGGAAVAIGHEASAGLQSVSVGDTAGAGVNGAAIGWESAAGMQSVAVGRRAAAGSMEGVAVGESATATAANAVAMGRTAAASGVGATAVGHRASAAGQDAAAIGSSAQASVYRAVALGQGSKATSTAAVALGGGATAAHQRSVAVGEGSATTAEWQVAVGARHVELLSPGTAPSAPAAGARLFARTVDGKGQLCVRFPSGAVQVISTEP